MTEIAKSRHDDKPRTKILLVEDLTLSRTGFRALLESSDEVEVIGEAADGREAVKLAKKFNPDVVLMDVAMPELNGIEATRQIHAAQPDVRIIMLSMHSDRQYIFESFRAGASGYVPKDVAFAEFLDRHPDGNGRHHLSQSAAYGSRHGRLRSPGQGQAGNQRSGETLQPGTRSLQLIAEGKSSSEVAQVLHISIRTVDTHRHNIMEKLDIHSIAGLTKFAIRHGLCTSDSLPPKGSPIDTNPRVAVAGAPWPRPPTTIIHPVGVG